ncbi:MAG TPA: hypothetical protein VG033_04425 [Candidatus Acidoferrales bacterium]|jgi:hypothetical protein|nr:hypothetical protein [Candidatus Acidoferrales bacterium]
MKAAILAVVTLCLGMMLLDAPAARADELRLKDGTKIVGKIVGFEDDSFRVETSYGFALVRKDKVAMIVVAEAAKKPEKKEAAPVEAKAAPAPAAPKKAAPTAPATSAAPAPSTADPATEDAATPPKKETPPAPAPAAPVVAKKAASPPPAPAPEPAKPAAPEPMREEVSGNAYTNFTYGFRLYKPPGWSLIEGARTMLPGTIAALGTSDETTYLVIGQEPLGKSLESHVGPTEKRLEEVMENYRPLGEKRLSVSGVPAIERRFRGSVDQHDWSGVVAFVARDNQVFTIFGMTYSDSDLVQIQENVIARAIASLEFIPR